MANIINVGGKSYDVDLFEGQYPVPDGITFNSYLIDAEKTCLVDTVDATVADVWADNLDKALKGRTLDFLVVQHVEPDHSFTYDRLLQAYPDVTVVANAKAQVTLNEYYGVKTEKFLTVKEGDLLDLGGAELKFVFAPMVHWPEVMMSFETVSGTLFSADAFGKFGAEEGGWPSEARRYYFNIVGKYGAQVQSLLKKLPLGDVKKICPLHGNVLSDNLSYYVGLYDGWSAFKPETDGVFIAYASIYNHTKAVALTLENELNKRGVTVTALDVARTDMSFCVSEAFRYSTVVFASPTLDADVFPVMRDFVVHLKSKNFQNRKVAFIENGTWLAQSARLIRQSLETQKNITFAATTVTMLASPTAETFAAVSALADELAEK